MSEKRKFRRYDSALKVIYRSQGLASLEGESTAVDISRGGIRLSVSRIIRKGSILKLDIYPKDGKDPLSVSGTVKWTQLNTENPRFNIDAGIQFAKTIAPYEADWLVSV